MERVAVPLNKKIFIQRDYSSGTAVRFSDEFPQELRGKVKINNSYTLLMIVSVRSKHFTMYMFKPLHSCTKTNPCFAPQLGGFLPCCHTLSHHKQFFCPKTTHVHYIFIFISRLVREHFKKPSTR